MINFRSLVVLGIMPLMCVPAMASWELHYECSGSSSGVNPTADQFDWPTNTTVAPRFPKVGDGGSPLIFPEDEWAVDSMGLQNNGTVTAVFKWIGANPPKFLSVRETSTAQATVDNEDRGPFTLPAFDVSNGLESSPMIMEGQTAGKRITGSKLTLWPVSSSGEVRIDARTLTASVTADEDTGTFNPRAYVEYSAAEDTRSVKLTRSGAIGDWFDDEGVPHGDTTYSYFYDPTVLGTVPGSYPSWHQPLRQVFAANFMGNWGETTSSTGFGTRKGESSSWSPAGEVDNWNYSLQLMPDGQLKLERNGNWSGSAGTQSDTTRTITYDVTDTDGTTATATYVLHIHEPVEIVSDSKEVLITTATVFQADGNPIVRSNSQTSPPGNPPTDTFGTGESSGWDVSATTPESLKFLNPLGVQGSYHSDTQNYREQSIVRPPIGAGKIRYLRVKHHYNRHHVLHWIYTPSGKIRRMVAGAPDRFNPAPQMEVPHELFYDRYLGPLSDQLEWSEEIDKDYGAPERDPNAPSDSPNQPNPTLPQPSYNFS